VLAVRLSQGLFFPNYCVDGKLKLRKPRDLPRVIWGVNERAGTKNKVP
jgi:hypothetical protein